MMNSQIKENDTPALCRNHSGRSDKELYRVCPSKLSKRELEDLYFTLLENNLELKKINNSQQDKIRLLSTKVQRMTATQKATLAKDPKDCCPNTKSLVNQHKESITELKRTNDRMTERIRVLNMRLCSAKQFLKRSPPACTGCSKCIIPNARSSVVSMMNTKRSDANLKKTVSCQCLDEDTPIKNVALNVFDGTFKWFSGLTKLIKSSTVATATNDNELESPHKPCDENKCRTQIEELNQKIVNLQEELFKTHEEYTTRITQLEEEMARVQNDNQRLREEHAAGEYELQQRQQISTDLGQKLRATAARQGELETQLTIEKRKVTELEAAARAAAESRAAIERHLANANTSQMKTEDDKELLETISSPYFTPRWESSPSRLEVPSRTQETHDKSDYKASDDSGYTEANKSQDEDKNKDLNQMNKNLFDRLSSFQDQMEDLKNTANNAVSTETPKQENPNEKVIEDDMSVMIAKCVESVYSYNKAPYKKILEKSLKDQEIADEKMKDFAQTKTCQDVDSNLEDETPRKNLSQKSDTHNSLQIPGPLPVDTITKEAKAKAISKRKEKPKTAKIKQSVDPKVRGSITKNIYSDASISQSKGNMDARTSLTDSIAMMGERPKSEVEKKAARTLSINEDSIAPYLEQKARENKLKFQEKGIQHVDSISSENTERIKKVQTRNAAVETDEISEKEPELVFCSRYARVCHCPAVARRDVSVYRSCSGTLRFNTADAPARAGNAADKLNHCDCRNLALKPALGTQTDACTISEQSDGVSKGHVDNATFNVPGARTSCRRQSRGTTPDNTDAEISSLTDLPSENDSKPARRGPRSPGEDKATTTSTCTDSATQPATDYGSLSEGELPAPLRDKKLSTTEAKVNFAINDPISYRVEEALQAVGVELARCRELLSAHRPAQSQQRQPSLREVGLMTEVNLGAPLKRKHATPSIGDAFAPKSVFTLHIGTVVLSDEAVMNSRDMSLMLTWKFFDHEAAMTRMRAGRVVLFNFSTEYDVKITPDFLNYLKHEEMPLFICEMGEQTDSLASCSLATCSLPLRDALLHANRRADLSLALIAGPKLKRARAARRDSLDSGDEVGVLDLWYTLRVDPAQLPFVNQAIAKTVTPPSTAKASGNTTLDSNINTVKQVNVTDDENSADGWLNRELAASKKRTSIFYNPDKCTRMERRSVASQSTSEFFKRNYNKEPAPYSSLNKDNMIKSTEVSSVVNKEPSTVHTIMNEVPVTIKSAAEMKNALDHNLNQDEMPTTSKYRKNTEDNASQTHSTMNAWRRLVTRQLKSKQADRASNSTGSIRNSDKKDSGGWSKFNTGQLSARSPMSSEQVEEPPELNKTLAGSYKMLNTLKKSSLSKEENQLGTEDRHRQICVTILWLALNEECDAMDDPSVQRLYVAYEFMGCSGVELETPLSLPKPKGYNDKCSFNFSKTFQLNDCDLPLIIHMAKCRSNGRTTHDAKDCIVFTVISEPLEDPLGLENCQDIGYAYLYLGDLVAYSGDNSSYTEVVPVVAARAAAPACGTGVLAVRVDGLDVLRRCLLLHVSDYSSASG